MYKFRSYDGNVTCEQSARTYETIELSDSDDEDCTTALDEKSLSNKQDKCSFLEQNVTPDKIKYSRERSQCHTLLRTERSDQSPIPHHINSQQVNLSIFKNPVQIPTQQNESQLKRGYLLHSGSEHLKTVSAFNCGRPYQNKSVPSGSDNSQGHRIVRGYQTECRAAIRNTVRDRCLQQQSVYNFTEDFSDDTSSDEEFVMHQNRRHLSSADLFCATVRRTGNIPSRKEDQNDTKICQYFSEKKSTSCIISSPRKSGANIKNPTPTKKLINSSPRKSGANIKNLTPTKKFINSSPRKSGANIKNLTPTKKLRQTKLSFPKLEKTLYEELTESQCSSILEEVSQRRISEILLTVQYEQGFSLLNKPTGYCKTDYCTPSGIMMMVERIAGITKCYYQPMKNLETEYITKLRNFFDKILTTSSYVVCYAAQEVVAFLINTLRYSKPQACFHWNLLDPHVGSWLLDPDNPPESFSDVLKRFCVQEGDTEYDDCLNKTSKLLQLLSAASQKVFSELKAQELMSLFTEMEMKILPILAVMELRGICVNKSVLEDMKSDLEENMASLQMAANKHAGKCLNMNSVPQLRTVLYDDLKLDKINNVCIRETAVLKAKSTSEPVLRLLEAFHPLPKIILKYRHLQKIKSTYIDGLLQHVRNDSHIFTTWDQVAACTGRLTSCSPNLQSIPKTHVALESQVGSGVTDSSIALRSPFVPRLGYSFLAADFQHIEFRVFAHLARDPLLLQIFQNTERDVYLTLAEIWLCNGNSTATPEDREKSKRIVYAVMYGAGPGKLAEFLKVTEEEAAKIINSFLVMFPSLRIFVNYTIAKCRRCGELRTISGRRRLFPNIRNENKFLKGQSERQAINFVIQGSAADICKAAMLRVEEHLTVKRPDLDAHLILQLHDELLWEVRDSDLEEMKVLVKKTMEDNSTICGVKVDFTVPFPVIIKTGKNWDKLC